MKNKRLKEYLRESLKKEASRKGDSGEQVKKNSCSFKDYFSN